MPRVDREELGTGGLAVDCVATGAIETDLSVRRGEKPRMVRGMAGEASGVAADGGGVVTKAENGAGLAAIQMVGWISMAAGAARCCAVIRRAILFWVILFWVILFRATSLNTM